jgi:hypothetical protein
VLSDDVLSKLVLAVVLALLTVIALIRSMIGIRYGGFLLGLGMSAQVVFHVA